MIEIQKKKDKSFHIKVHEGSHDQSVSPLLSSAARRQTSKYNQTTNHPCDTSVRLYPALRKQIWCKPIKV